MTDKMQKSVSGCELQFLAGVCMKFKVKDAGANIDNTTLLFTTREWSAASG